MNLWEYRGKQIRVECIDEIIIEGKCVGYTQAIDNEPEIASIYIENDETIKKNTLYEVYENQIKSIEILVK